MRECPGCGSRKQKLIAKDYFTEGNLYLRCFACGSGYSLKEFQEDNLPGHYQDFYQAEGSLENKRWARESKHLLGLSKKYLERLARFKPSGKLLEVGCGRGEFIHVARQTGRYECVGVDTSAVAAREAEKLFGVKVVVSNFSAGLFKEQKFDVVYLRHVIEHVPDPRQFVAEIKAVCAPGGVVAVHLPNDLSWTNAFKRFLYRLAKIPECGSLCYPYHLIGYSPDSIRLLFEQAGFTHLETRTFSKLNPLYDFHWRYFDILLLPFTVLDTLPGKGNAIVSYFRLEGQ